MKSIIKKIKNKKGSALLIVMLIFFTIFILAFASGYTVFLNIYKSSDVSDSLRAYYAAKAGVERAQYEALKNNYNFNDATTTADIFSEILGNKASYKINCEVEIDDSLSFYSVGKYKKSQVALKIDCINIEEECQANCLQGSLCGGGKLLYATTSSTTISKFVVSPSGCNLAADSCDNDFIIADSIELPWEKSLSGLSSGASSTSDGLENMVILDPQTNIQFEAAKYCNDLEVNGFTDWYLPASDEIKSIVDLSDYFNFFTEDGYWSSTEATSTDAFLMYVDSSPTIEQPKNFNYNIRCLRKF